MSTAAAQTFYNNILATAQSQYGGSQAFDQALSQLLAEPAVIDGGTTGVIWGGTPPGEGSIPNLAQANAYVAANPETAYTLANTRMGQALTAIMQNKGVTLEDGTFLALTTSEKRDRHLFLHFAGKTGLESTLRPRGRPRKQAPEE